MKNLTLAALALALGMIAPLEAAALVFRIGDTVYADGKEYSWEQWKQVRDRYVPVADRATASATSPRAASCVTEIYYREFPSDDERFACNRGLGAMTRDEILRAGWKIDFIDKVPAPREAAPAGREELYKYKLVLSCPDACSGTQAAPNEAQVPLAPAKPLQHDNLCLDDCLGSGGTRAFCESRCAY